MSLPGVYGRQRPATATPEEWDAALRLSDRVANHLVAHREMAVFHWIAVSLDRGDGGDTLYDTREDAVAAQLAPQYMTFLRITPDGMSPMSAWRYMRMSREVYKRHRTPFHRPEFFPILPQRRELARGLFS